jgi:hypothetical protein
VLQGPSIRRQRTRLHPGILPGRYPSPSRLQATCGKTDGCVWCRCKAVPSACFQVEQAKHLPPAVFEVRRRSSGAHVGVTGPGVGAAHATKALAGVERAAAEVVARSTHARKHPALRLGCAWALSLSLSLCLCHTHMHNNTRTHAPRNTQPTYT